MNRFQTHIVGVISIDGLHQDAPHTPGEATPQFPIHPPGLWPDIPESVVSADNEQLQFELESAYLDFMHQVT